MKKRFMSILLALVMVIGMLPMASLTAFAATESIYVGGVELSDGQYLATGGTTATGTAPQDVGYAHYDAAKGVLTLNNYKNEGKGYETGDAPYVDFYAIYSTGALEIQLVGTNTLTSTDTTFYTHYGICSDSGNVTITGDGTVSITVTAKDGFGFGIYAYEGDVEITDGTVEIAETTEEVGNGAGIYAETGDVSIAGGKVDITATMRGIYAYEGDVEITDGTVDITVTEDECAGILAYYGAVAIGGGAVTIDALGNSGKGIDAGGNVEITDGTVDITATMCGIYAYEGDVEITSGEVTIDVTADDGVGICADDGDVSIGGGAVTINVYGNSGYGIDAYGVVTITDGTVTVNATTSISGTNGIEGYSGVSIEGGTVIVNASSHGIYSDDDVSITNGTVNVTANLKGIYAFYGDVSITGGTVTLKGGERAIDYNVNFAADNMTIQVSEELNGPLVLYDEDDDDIEAYKYVYLTPGGGEGEGEGETPAATITDISNSLSITVENNTVKLAEPEDDYIYMLYQIPKSISGAETEFNIFKGAIGKDVLTEDELNDPAAYLTTGQILPSVSEINESVLEYPIDEDSYIVVLKLDPDAMVEITDESILNEIGAPAPFETVYVYPVCALGFDEVKYTAAEPAEPAEDISEDLSLTVIGSEYTVNGLDEFKENGYYWNYSVVDAAEVDSILHGEDGVVDGLAEVPSETWSCYDTSEELDGYDSFQLGDGDDSSDVVLIYKNNYDYDVSAYAVLPLAEAEKGEDPGGEKIADLSDWVKIEGNTLTITPAEGVGEYWIDMVESDDVLGYYNYYKGRPVPQSESEFGDYNCIYYGGGTQTGEVELSSPYVKDGDMFVIATFDQSISNSNGSYYAMTGVHAFVFTPEVTVDQFTIIYTDGVDGTVFENQTFTVDEGAATPAFVGTPTRSGYTFKGWDPAVAATVTADATYTATWEAEEVVPTKYTVTVNGSYASTTGAGEYKAGETVTIYAGSRSGYSFDGWTSSDVTITDKYSNTATFVMPDKAVTVTANWEKDKWDVKYPPVFIVTDDTTAAMMPEKDVLTFADAVDLYQVQIMAQSGSFIDVAKADWFYSDVTALVSKGIINGYPDGSFRPQGEVTWGEALKLVMKAVSYGDIAPTNDHWASGYMETALDDLLISCEVDLDAAITREEVANLTAQALKLAPAGIAYPFDDAAPESAVALYAAGIINGSADNGQLLFRAESTITRAEMAAIIWRVYCAR